jgi:hypothetical protein
MDEDRASPANALILPARARNFVNAQQGYRTVKKASVRDREPGIAPAAAGPDARPPVAVSLKWVRKNAGKNRCENCGLDPGEGFRRRPISC